MTSNHTHPEWKMFSLFFFRKVTDSQDSLEHVQEVLERKTFEFGDKQSLVENLEKTLLIVRFVFEFDVKF